MRVRRKISDSIEIMQMNILNPSCDGSTRDLGGVPLQERKIQVLEKYDMKTFFWSEPEVERVIKLKANTLDLLRRLVVPSGWLHASTVHLKRAVG